MKVLIDELRREVNASKFFGLSFDDSKAIDNTEFMSVECYYVSATTGKQISAFVKLRPVGATNAAALAQTLASFVLLKCRRDTAVTSHAELMLYNTHYHYS